MDTEERRDFITQIRRTVTAANNTQYEVIKAHFETLENEVAHIKETSEGTNKWAKELNGRLYKQELAVELLKASKVSEEKDRTATCPQNPKISILWSVYVNWKMYAIVGLVLACGAVSGAVVGYESFRSLIKRDIAIEQQAKIDKAASLKANKTQDEKIDANTKTNNEQNNENTLRNSLEENK